MAPCTAADSLAKRLHAENPPSTSMPTPPDENSVEWLSRSKLYHVLVMDMMPSVCTSTEQSQLQK
ncbi:hypothetical protein NQZ68_029472 [Dissostichus eleginoides]|nr:hypothetical protein NQZ68_029472 [Dissostichus eleginoides]